MDAPSAQADPQKPVRTKDFNGLRGILFLVVCAVRVVCAPQTAPRMQVDLLRGSEYKQGIIRRGRWRPDNDIPPGLLAARLLRLKIHGERVDHPPPNE